MRINQRIARDFIARAKLQGYKGKALDCAALNFFCGAAVALADDPRQEQVIFASMLISARGFDEVLHLAEDRSEASAA